MSPTLQAWRRTVALVELEWFNENSGAVQAAGTLVLVVITAWYAYLTLRMVRATRRRPELVLLPKRHFATLSAVVANVGNAPALHVEVSVRFHSTDPEWDQVYDWQTGVIDPGDRYVFEYKMPASYEESRQAMFHGKKSSEVPQLPPHGIEMFDHVERVTVDGMFREIGSRRIRPIRALPIVDLADTAQRLQHRAERVDGSDVAEAITELVSKRTSRNIRI